MKNFWFFLSPVEAIEQSKAVNSPVWHYRGTSRYYVTTHKSMTAFFLAHPSVYEIYYPFERVA